MALALLKKRKEFLTVARVGLYQVSPSLVIQCLPREREGLRFGFTASKKVGNAVQRNFAKRRMRALVSSISKRETPTSCDLVLIARQEILKRPFNKIEQDYVKALKKLYKKIGGQ